ncbi:MAG: Hsp33 family molecular chaperone HslO [Proteobacteria bacterium]|nr:Hsp33 family molecular chaperone HslO [Pseudomonadota bacterium]MBU1386452.1 Hsp33 family molecular chaperone HslO [Pseudomonadota bacterium]MBU1544563.1 Hsp33 family molecular chaperone HslO [Pseudomonadota bacterium]MBU2481226.1 Hsp33 family molecular chaperone HslO [Pseudomonadota bacterium]
MIKKDIFNKDVKEQFRAAAKDRIYRFVVADGMIKGAVIHATRMVGEMQANHELGPLETLILGQGYIAAGLLSSSLKAKNDRISMNIKCSGPVKGLDVESNVFGEVRGYLKTPHIEVENPDRIKYLSTLYGAGFLTMTKYLDNTPHPYSGQVALEYGSIAEDLANYFLISEQLPTGFKLSVYFDDENTMKGAGGIFLQAMPGADADKVIAAEKIIQTLDSLGQLFAQDQTPEQIIKDAFSSLDPVILADSRIEFFCRCSKDRMQGYLNALSREEKEDMMRNGPFPVKVRCHHCNSEYMFSQEELKMLVD